MPAPFIVVVDANVLFPLSVRNTVLRAAAADFYQLRWSKDILDEMERNLVSTKRMAVDKAARLRAQMETFFPEAMGHRLRAASNTASDGHGECRSTGRAEAERARHAAAMPARGTYSKQLSRLRTVSAIALDDFDR